jgi:TorA maturation chaperone TorD/DNA-binding transcriptional regulator YdaS (Cro superfamily)
VRDAGLKQAIDKVGGVSELARRIGIAQPSVSNWDRIPADRVVMVEAVTGIPRTRLRPDLYGEAPVSGEIDEIDAERAREYALLSALLSRAPSKTFLVQLGRLRGNATPLGLAHARLGEAAAQAAPADVEREFFDLFIGIGRSELLPYASYYLTGFLNERPLARLREDLARLGIERVDGNYEPEDHAATLCEIMSGLAARSFPAPPGADRELFEKHIQPWMGRLFADMENANGAAFYRSVGTLGRLFLEIEKEAFALAD